jgi:hypothetical protein
LEKCLILLWLMHQGPAVPTCQVCPQLDADTTSMSNPRQQHQSKVFCMQGMGRKCWPCSPFQKGPMSSSTRKSQSQVPRPSHKISYSCSQGPSNHDCPW